MGIWTRFASALRGEKALSFPNSYLTWMQGTNASSSGILVNAQTAMQTVAVYACVKVLAESIAQLPLGLYVGNAQSRSKTAVDGDGLGDLLRYQPNEYQTATEFFEMMVAHLNLRGNAYAYITRASQGRVVELIPLPPDSITVDQVGNSITYRGPMANGGMYDFKPTEILHMRGLTLNGYIGISPISYNREAIGLAVATSRFGAQLFRNGAKAGGVLTHPMKLSEDAHKRLKGSIDDSYSGDNAHKTMVLEEGMKFEKITITPEDAQFLETRKLQRSEIAGMFRVPSHMINDLEHATFSNVEHLSLDFVKYSLLPWLKRIELALRRSAFTDKQRQAGMFAKFDVSELLRGDTTARSAYYTAGIAAGWLTRADARYMEDLNPISGLEVPLVMTNMADGTKPPTPPVVQPAGFPPKPPAKMNGELEHGTH